MLYRSLNPATEEVVAKFPTATDREVDAALDRADAAFRLWRRSPFAERCAVNERLADLLEAQADELAALMALEMGKPLAQGVAEAQKCAWVARHYAETAEESLRTGFRSDSPVDSGAVLRGDRLSPLFQAAIEATEEAVYNSMLKATTIVGKNGNTREAISIEDLLEVGAKYNRLHQPGGSRCSSTGP